jgi:hypothetical protein
MGTDINIKKRIAVQEESVTITSDVNSINITGDGATASAVGNDVTINIPGGSGSITYYLNETITQAPYKEFSSIPTSAVEQTIANTVGAGATITVQSFQTASGVPGTTNIPAGLWSFYLHFSGTGANTFNVYVEVYKRDLGGIETLLLTTDSISTTPGVAPSMTLTDGVFPATTLLTTDRIVVKVKAENTEATPSPITFYTEGTTNYSVSTTTLNQTVPTGAVTSVTGTAPIASSGGTTPAISISQATSSTDGYLSSADWNTFNGKQDAITLTTTGTSGAATLIGSTLNIPQYLSGLTYFTEAQSTVAPNATVPVDSLTALAATANADIALVPKGSGAFTLAVADNTITGGNKRGTNAIDLQTTRTNADQVASGNNSVVIGANSKASANQGVAIGTGALASAAAIALNGNGNITGSNAVASGIGSFAANGGQASNLWSFAMGRAVASGIGSFAFGGYFAGNTASGDYGSLAIGEGNTASGQSSVALGGSNAATSTQAVSIGGSNTASGGNSVAIGKSNNSTGTSAVSLGTSNTSAGYGSTTVGLSNTTAYDFNYAFGYANTLTSGPVGNNSYVFAFGLGNTVNAPLATAIGCYGLTNGVTGRQTFSSGRIATNGDAQKSTFFYRGRTTDATLTNLATDGGGGINISNCMQLANNSSIRFKGTISGKQSGSTNIAAWDVDGLIVRGASAAATTLTIGNVNLVSNIPGWGTPVLSAFIDAFNGVGALRIQIQGAAATNIQWTGVIETTEVIYA